MLKITVLHSQKPIESQSVEMSPEPQQDYLVGSGNHCQLSLPSSDLTEIVGRFSCREGQYYFTSLVENLRSQFNDETTHLGRPYHLGIDDIIRLEDYVLIIDEAPHKGNAQGRRRLPRSPKAERPENPGQATPRSQQLLKNITKKRTINNPEAINKPENTDLKTRPIAQSVSGLPLPPTALPFPTVAVPIEKNSPNASPKVVKTAEDSQWWSKGELKVRCVEIIDETPDVKTFRWLAQPKTLFRYLPGQFVTLHLTIDDKPIKRSYSISSTPSRPNLLEITVKRVPPPADHPDAPPGLVSNWLHDQIQVGSEITISGPFGKFTCGEQPSRDLLFISAGSGITPMMSMSRWAMDTVCDRDILFLHSARSVSDLIYHLELENLAARYPRFRLIFTLTRPQSADNWTGLTGRLTAEMLNAIAPDFRERLVYVCGPEPFMASVKTLLTEIDYPMDQYHEESFGGVPKNKGKTTENKQKNDENTPELSSTVKITFSQSGLETTSDGTVSLLELAEELGVALDSSCRSGACGTCKVKKLRGDIRYEGDADALSPDEEEAGFCLSCIAYPVSDVNLVV